MPTSVGYGAAFGGVSPLLSALTAGAPGVATVNVRPSAALAALPLELEALLRRFLRNSHLTHALIPTSHLTAAYQLALINHAKSCSHADASLLPQTMLFRPDSHAYLTLAAEP